MAKTALKKAAEYEQIFQELGNIPDKIFDSMKDVFMFAAALGFHRKKRVPFQKSGGEDISLRFFKDEDENIFNIMALADTNDMSILLPDEEHREKKYRIVEEYANGGMSIMAGEFCRPIVDEGAFQRFIEAFDDDSDEAQKSSLEDILAKALDLV